MISNDRNLLEGEFAPEPEKQFYSVGFLCQMIQVTPAQLLVLMEAAGARYAYAVDGQGMIRGDDVLKMSDKAAEIRQEISSAATSFARN